MYRSPKPARPARPCVPLTSSSLVVTPQAPAERGEGSCCTVCPSPGGAVPAGLARSREKPGSRTRSAAEGEHRTGEDFSAAALDRTSQTLGQGSPCIGDGRAVQHPRAADSTHPPRHATALPGQPLAGSWGHFRARKSSRVPTSARGKPSAQRPSGRGGVRDRKSATKPSETPQAARCAAPEPAPASLLGDGQAMLSSCQATLGLRHRGRLAGRPRPSRTD